MMDLVYFSNEFKIEFEKEKSRISKFLVFGEINHIGSTAIIGMVGKGIIDMMIAVDDWERKFEVIKILKELDYSHVHKEEKGRIFLSKKAETKSGDFHIHLVRKESQVYKNLFKFVEILNKNKKLRKDYEKLKLELNCKSRIEYGKIKGEFIASVLKIENKK